MLPFILPTINKGETNPIWTGKDFLINGKTASFLNYSTNINGWMDELTNFHVQIAGDDHTIDIASRNDALVQLERNLPLQKASVILEVGTSSGIMLRAMKEKFENSIIIGSDCIPNLFENLAKEIEGVPLIQFDLIQCPLPDSCIDAVVMLNVLEHVRNDAEAIRQVYRILKPGGVLILEVPAGPLLYDVYDKYLLHRRRYSMRQLKKLMITQGFKLIRKSHLGFFLFPLFWAVKKHNQQLLLRGSADFKSIVKKNIIKTQNNHMMALLMRIELFLGRIVSYPIGIRCLLTCKKVN